MIGHISRGSLRGKHLRSTVVPPVTLGLLVRPTSQGLIDLQDHQSSTPRPGQCPIQKPITGSRGRQALSTRRCNDSQRQSRGQGPPLPNLPSRRRTHGRNNPAAPPLPVQPPCSPDHPTLTVTCLTLQCKGNPTTTIEMRMTHVGAWVMCPDTSSLFGSRQYL